MNSEELELSLRTEFESYLKTLLAEMRQEATEFQSRIETEFDKHKTQFDEAFQVFAVRFDSDREFDEAFTGSVAEHLRLARDEGARITADAMAEAEKLDQAVAPAANFDVIRDAVNDISIQGSQSTILKALVSHAAEFAPRGAFFIIKNEHFAGWKVFGTEGDAAENAIGDIHFPISADSILSASVQSCSTVDSSEGAHSDDSSFLEPLQFGHPDRMYAIPLVARGRGVAVLYADYGNDGINLNREALETLVRVAGLTVELLASSQSAKAQNHGIAATDIEDSPDETNNETAHATELRFDDTGSDMHDEVPASMESMETEPTGFTFTDDVSYQDSFPREPEFTESLTNVPTEAFSADQEIVEAPFVEDDALAEDETKSDADVVSAIEAIVEAPVSEDETSLEDDQSVEPVEVEPIPEADDTGGAIVFDSDGPIESTVFGGSPFDQAAEEYEAAGVVSTGGFDHAVEPTIEVPVARAPQERLRDRPVDLPIEVPEEDRRIHNDARRFARLLVSEIKLYNEKKVIEGREAQDLYERLREAIDRSREMYDKRVQPPVAAKFDYFHYELVNALAEGDAERLGTSYPGSSV